MISNASPRPTHGLRQDFGLSLTLGAYEQQRVKVGTFRHDDGERMGTFIYAAPRILLTERVRETNATSRTSPNTQTNPPHWTTEDRSRNVE